ncbi:MAG: aminotransferase class V-fold PLP-dependent enzyme [Actinobacteria bacterium]|nr:aminotransferase class V-fold PLP-dependent enzyme [Actinomycetota bacterium]
MHYHDQNSEKLAAAVVDYALDRIRLDPPPLDAPKSLSQLQALVGNTITPEGLGGLKVLEIFTQHLARACISVDHPLFLSFVPGAPTESAVLFDLVLSASNIYGGSWLESAGAVFAENQALQWVASLANFPSTSSGVFVSGGTAGNLSALIVARWRWRQNGKGALDRVRPMIVSSSSAHSSVGLAANAMDADIVKVEADAQGRMSGVNLRNAVASLDPQDRDRVCAVVATAGTTNLGVIDDLVAASDQARELGAWFHVDGAYGAAALCAPSVRHLFVGIERADSFIVDPHKWLFGPFDCCALIYRDPDTARRAHTQRAEYLEVLTQQDLGDALANPSDLAHHLSRRARGLPFWFSVATHGTEAYEEAMEITLQVTREATALIKNAPYLELLLEPELSVIIFKRKGWSPEQYQTWSDRMLNEGRAFVVPTTFNGETILRFCIINPRTTIDEVADILKSLE